MFGICVIDNFTLAENCFLFVSSSLQEKSVLLSVPTLVAVLDMPVNSLSIASLASYSAGFNLLNFYNFTICCAISYRIILYSLCFFKKEKQKPVTVKRFF